MSKECQFCSTRGDFGGCSCGHGSTLDCAEKPTCPDCQTAHRKTWGPFFRFLLETKAASRSNSPRTLLLDVLHAELVYQGKNKIGERAHGYCLDCLRSTSPFDENNRNFRACIALVAQSLPLSAEIGKSLSKRLATAHLERKFQQLADAMRAKFDSHELDERLEKELGTFAKVCEVVDRVENPQKYRPTPKLDRETASFLSSIR
jgi:hypothetical protein